MSNTFTKLYSVDCSMHVENKNGFSYLSWPFAVAQLRSHDPKATWRTIRHEGMPYLKTECGFFVEVEVTVDGIALSQIHPVLDHRNKPIAQPDAFHINTSIQRCMVKAMALHGIGLSIYAGEDVPNPANLAPSNISEAEAAEIRTLIGKTGSDERSFLAYVQAQSVDQITLGAMHSKALTALKSKLKKLEEKKAQEEAAAAEKAKQETPTLEQSIEEVQHRQPEVVDEAQPSEEIDQDQPASEPNQPQKEDHSASEPETHQHEISDPEANGEPEAKPRRRRRN